MKFLLTDGRTIDAPKDCECADHAGPHWLHANTLWKKANDQLRATALDETAAPSTRYFARLGLAREESARLAEKLQAMKTHRIERIISDCMVPATH